MNDRGRDIPQQLNSLCEDVIGAAIEVHREIGPGMAERIYEEALCHEFNLRDIPFDRQVAVRVDYKNVKVGEHRLDLLVGGTIVLELKALDTVADQHLAQLVSYLNAGPFPLGLLLNFGSRLMKEGIYRRINSLCLSSAPLRSSAPPRTGS